jgi:hypothetical protein
MTLPSRFEALLPAAALTAAALLFAALASVGCSNAPSSGTTPASEPPDQPGPPWFEDVTDRLGIDFVHDAGPTGTYFLPQIVGSGCAAIDLDGDGRPDLLFLSNGGPKSKSTNKLYRQRPDGTFDDVTAGSGLDFAGHCMGVAVGDVNNDGKPDVLITLYTGARLFLNQGSMKFRDVTAAAGIHNPLWGASACFFDYDRDGWLDLVIANYLDYDPAFDCTSPGGEKDYCAPKGFAGTATKLFRNLGPQADGAVRFEDVSVASGVGGSRGRGWG